MPLSPVCSICFNISVHEVVLLNQTDYDNITLTCSFTMPFYVPRFQWSMGETVIGTYQSGNCEPIGTEPLPGYSAKCGELNRMTLVVQPRAIMDSMKEWMCVARTMSDDDITSTPLELKGITINTFLQYSHCYCSIYASLYSPH